MDSSTPFSVTVHPYQSPVRNSCGYEAGSTKAKNAVLFIGGLFDGPHTVLYTRLLAKYLEKETDLDYSLFEIRLRSSFIGFGTSSLKNDVQDISAFVKYLRSIGKEKIVLFGHSTGCQDCMEYADYGKHDSIPVDAFIMQAAVSDREALKHDFSNYDQLVAAAEELIMSGQPNEYIPAKMLPADFEVPITAYRMNSLLVKGGDDDYFSSDLDEATVARFWSRFTKPVLVLQSEKDEFVPAHVDKVALLQRFKSANSLVDELSGCIPKASHTVTASEGQQWLVERVAKFLRTL